jgi:hypothetical protein
MSSFQRETIDQYNNRKFDWRIAYILIRKPNLAKAHSLGLL